MDASLANALRLVNHRKAGCQLYFRFIQRELDTLLGCRTAYAGSLALYLQGEVDRYGDLDVLTDRMFLPSDLPWDVDRCSRYGLKSDRWGLDMFFVRDADNVAMMELANNHVIEVGGIRVQSADFVKEINWFWRDDSKPRLVKPSTNAELLAALS